MRYPTYTDDDIEHVTLPSTYYMACCDCGLIHRIELDTLPTSPEPTLVWRWVREIRRTAQRRRALKRRREGVYAD